VPQIETEGADRTMKHSALQEMPAPVGSLRADPLTTTPNGERGVVLSWHTKIDAPEFLTLCNHFLQNPRALDLIEVIADDEFVEFDRDAVDSASLRKEIHKTLSNRKLVRLNTHDWSVTWLEADGAAPREIQACMSTVPNVMAKMITESISDRNVDVPDFVDRLRALNAG
jgi:hypothetical protein